LPDSRRSSQRVAQSVEVKRYQDRVGRSLTVSPDPIAGAVELAAVCRVYPDKETYALVAEARAGVPVGLGVAALQLATGRAQDESKD
jgi:hypothetical protein